MAGTEFTGFENSFKELFYNAKWIIEKNLNFYQHRKSNLQSHRFFITGWMMNKEERMMRSKQKMLEMLDTIQEMFPNAKCELNHRNEFDLLIAVLLSAQCTDKLVN